MLLNTVQVCLLLILFHVICVYVEVCDVSENGKGVSYESFNLNFIT